MGCGGSSLTKADGTSKKIRKPKPWKLPQPITKSQLNQMREEFWDTAPHYGGRKGRWKKVVKMKGGLTINRVRFLKTRTRRR